MFMHRVYIFTETHTHTHIYIYIYIYVALRSSACQISATQSEKRERAGNEFEAAVISIVSYS